MTKRIAQILQIIFVSTYLQISAREDIYVERFPRHDQHPLPDIKFLTFDQERSLNVLLYYFRTLFLPWLNNVFDLIRTVNTQTACVEGRFDDPDVAHTVYQPVLGHDPG